MSGTTGRVKAYGTGKGPRQRHRPDQLVHEQYKRQQLTSAPARFFSTSSAFFSFAASISSFSSASFRSLNSAIMSSAPARSFSVCLQHHTDHVAARSAARQTHHVSSLAVKPSQRTKYFLPSVPEQRATRNATSHVLPACSTASSTRSCRVRLFLAIVFAAE